jgi:hypothetical protein
VDRLSRAQIVDALEAVANELAPTTAPRELIVVGGAALVLLYDVRASTKDVDVAAADPDVLAAGKRVASRLGLPDDWLNDAAKGYLHGLSPGDIVFRSGTLVVRTPALYQLLAMKLSAWRDDVDIEDARLLLTKLGGDRTAIWQLVEPHLLPGRELKARYAFDDLWEVVRGDR